MEAIRAAYEKTRGAHLTIQYGGSSTLLTSLRASHDADIFLPADDSYIKMAKSEGLVIETISIAKMRPVLSVKKGNPLGIHTLDDLLTKNIRISMTDPTAAATGKLVQDCLEKAGQWDAFKSRVTVFKGTVSEVAADLQIGAVDAAIVWDAMLRGFPDFEEAALPEFAPITAHVVAGVVAQSKNLPAASDLADFLATPNQGQRFFLDAGFSPP